jgi:hypothetical protein
LLISCDYLRAEVAILLAERNLPKLRYADAFRHRAITQLVFIHDNDVKVLEEVQHVEVIRGLPNPIHPGQKLIADWKTREESPQGSSNRKIHVRADSPKQSQARLDPRQIDDLVTAYQSRNTIKDLAVQFQIHHATVSNLFERRGVPRWYRPLTPQQIDHAVKAYQAGSSSEMIGDLLGVDASTIWRTLRRERLKMRDSYGRAQEHKSRGSARMRRIHSENPG